MGHMKTHNCEYLEVWTVHVVCSLVGTVDVGGRQVRQPKLVPGAAIKCQVQLGVGKILCCLGAIHRVYFCLCQLQILVRRRQPLVARSLLRRSRRPALPSEEAAHGAPANFDNTMKSDCAKVGVTKYCQHHLVLGRPAKPRGPPNPRHRFLPQILLHHPEEIDLLVEGENDGVRVLQIA